MIKKLPNRVLKPQHDTPGEAELTPHDYAQGKEASDTF